MSVIIEGLTLPKHNPKEIDKNVLIGYAIVKEDNTAELCLEGVHYLIKMLPTPHGRLIDADELKKNMRNYYPSIDHLCCSQHVITKRDIDCAPTIIEAEGASDGKL